MSVSIFISAMNNKYYIKISFICISIFFCKSSLWKQEHAQFISKRTI